MTDDEYRQAAKDILAAHGHDPECDVDDDAVVSACVEGAYVQVWLWVPNKTEDA